ncbi:hypothetical protein FOA52_009888 [Chlamydomonas sp. UWO 241]|nr:hypothetical protein FOA52_009888 [Chlamydomonas sp. UWO 241]
MPPRMQNTLTGPPAPCECECRPPKPAKQWQVKKNNENHGRWFSCNACAFFEWADGQPSRVPPEQTQQQQQQQQQQQHGATPTSPPSPAAAAAAAAMQRTATPGGTRPIPPSFGGGYGHAAAGAGGAGGSPATPRTGGGGAASPAAGGGGRGAGPSNGGGGDAPFPAVKLQLLTHDVFAASFPFDERLVKIIQALPWTTTGRTWDKDQGHWRLQLRARRPLLEAFREAGAEVEDIPAHVLATAAEDSSAGRAGVRWLPEGQATATMAATLPQSTRDALFEFQREGVQFIVRAGGRALLADEPGLGKTMQAVCAAACFPDAWPLLVICPSSMRWVWAAAVNDWLPEGLLPEPGSVWVLSSGKDISKALANPVPHCVRAHVCITSYDLVQKLPPDLLDRYQIVVCDEAHMLKSRETKRTRFISAVVRKAKHAVLLTGTPLLAKPIDVFEQKAKHAMLLTGTPLLAKAIDVFEQVDMLRPGLLGTYWAFGNRYCVTPWFRNRALKYPGQEFSGSNNLDELSHVLCSSVLLRRTKAQVAQQLPEKVRTRIVIDVVDQHHQRDLRMAQGRMASVDARKAGGELVPENEVKQVIMEYYRATGPGKVSQGWEFARGLLGPHPSATGVAAEGGGKSNKMLLFCHHQNVMDALEAKLKAEHWGFVRIDGSVSDVKRQQAVSSFQSDPSIQVALLSIAAAGVGLTLTAASVAVFMELVWSPSLLLQAEDRLHRIGQTASSVQIYYLHGRGTADDLVWPTVNKKLKAPTTA